MGIFSMQNGNGARGMFGFDINFIGYCLGWLF